MAERGLPPQLYYPSDLKGKNNVRVTISWPDSDGIDCPAFKGAVIAGM
jgi:hypothetical protein